MLQEPLCTIFRRDGTAETPELKTGKASNHEGSSSYLINVFTLDSITTVANWALSTLPGTIRETGALDSSKAGIGQASI